MGMGMAGGSVTGSGRGPPPIGSGDLLDWLRWQHLERFHGAMQEQGLVLAEDLRDLGEEEMDAIGMKRIERARLGRLVAALGAAV